MTFINVCQEDILNKAYEGLFSDSIADHDMFLNYSGRFSDYNAYVRMSGKRLEFKLSKKWQLIDSQIVIGLIQTLMLRILKKKKPAIKSTMNIELYHDFLKNIHTCVPKTKKDPKLEESFLRINEKFFLHSIEMPNLQWGRDTKKKLGSYDFHTDTISISLLLKDADQELLDYVMYHEMLHKKFKFKSSTSRTLYHSKAFREAEKRFGNTKDIENRLGKLRRRRSFFKW